MANGKAKGYLLKDMVNGYLLNDGLPLPYY